MTPKVFLTDRLVATSWNDDFKDQFERSTLERDLQHLLTIKVIEYLPPSLRLTDQPDNASVWIDSRTKESDVLLIRRKSDLKLIGTMILAYGSSSLVTQIIHLGYLYAESEWGKGYATETLRGLITNLKFHKSIRLSAGVSRENLASARVLQKSGFRVSKDLSTACTEMYVKDLPSLSSQL